MPKSYPTDLVQPIGSHNKKHPCVLTKEVKEYMDFPFEYFNPPQSDFLPYLEDDETNIVVAAATSSGKTVIAELFASRAIRLGKKALYIAPMKALADEKLYDWTVEKHPFNNYNIEVLTGDYKLTEEKKEKLLKANIIILTPEMFNSKCRIFKSHPWLSDSVFIGDEIHLIGLEGRGDSEEVGLVQYFENSPTSRALFLSATLPNVADFGEWLEHLTNRPSKVIISNYRPCKLNRMFVTFHPGQTYEKTEQRRMEEVIKYIQKFKKEPTLVFTGNKTFGHKLSKALDILDIDHRFHNADLDRQTKTANGETVYGRSDIERGFRNGDFNVLIATTTLAWGIDSSARYVLQCHTKFGITPMHPSNIIQAIGRAGRTGKSEKGDAYIFCSNREKIKEERRIFDHYLVESTLKDPDLLMFHILSYVNDGIIKDETDLYNWYGKTLASVQKHKLDLMTCKRVLENLKTRMMVTYKDGIYSPTVLGKITAQMYMSPLDVSDWFVNFSKISTITPRKDLSVEDEKKANLKIAAALAECYTHGITWKIGEDGKRRKSPIGKAYITEAEKRTDEVADVCEMYNTYMGDFPHIKHTALFFRLLNGGSVSPQLNSYKMAIVRDIERISATLQQCDERLGKKLKEKGKILGFGWGSQWNNLALRIKYGVRSTLAELVDIPGIGKVRAEKLEKAGITSKKQILNPKNKEICERALGKKTFEKTAEVLAQ